MSEISGLFLLCKQERLLLVNSKKQQYHMAILAEGGKQEIHSGNFPQVGSILDNYSFTKTDLSDTDLNAYSGKKRILNVFPSIDTGTCATSVRTFNQKAADLDNTVVLCISGDLPMAQNRFCGAEGIEGVEMLSQFRDQTFAKDTGLLFESGPLKGLDARAIIVLDEKGKITHTELVPIVGDEPNYDAALAAL